MTAGHPVELPNLFQFKDGRPVRTPGDWLRRRVEIRDTVVNMLYGGLPPEPENLLVELLHPHLDERIAFNIYRIVVEKDRRLTFTMSLLAPKEGGPFPAIIYGDACWPFLTDEIIREVLSRKYAIAVFNRTELASDIYTPAPETGLHRAYPGRAFGALAAWAWGYHRCVDALIRLEEVADPYRQKHLVPIDPKRIAIVGHSRGGKTTLLAGATDERIALTSANNSGAGGAGSYYWYDDRSEQLKDSLGAVAYWYNAEAVRPYIDRQGELPFDQHFLKAAIAPRCLLTTEALEDAWANPAGTWQTHRAAREAWRFLGLPERAGIWYRPGGHAHGLEDWRAFLDFADWQFRGVQTARRFDLNPFPDLPKAFSWSAPTAP